MTAVETVETVGAATAPDPAGVASHLHPSGSFEVEDHDVPTGREEIWRFTPLKRLRGLHKDAPLGAGGVAVRVDAPDGVRVERAPADSEARGASGYVPVDRVSARAWQGADGATVVTIPEEAEVEGITVLTYSGLTDAGLTDAELTDAGLTHAGAATGRAAAAHTVIVAKPLSTATVVLRFEGSATLADNVEIVVGDGAHLTVLSFQDWADDAVHHSAQHASVGRDATFRHVAVSFGGDLVRLNTSVAYAGPGGEAELLGLYFADSGQHLEHRLFVDHNAPKTRSNVDYKGALQGKGAHTVWIGDVLIRKVAEGIDTYESNRNLVLTDGCQADSVPNLEIETGEIVGAGHASTTGRFDDLQLFYLQSRGIPEDEARRLVVRGFFADIIRKIGVPEIERRMLQTVEAELERSVGSSASARPAEMDPAEVGQ